MTPTPPEVGPAQVGGVVVTQADRSRAAPYLGFAFRRCLEGECDSNDLVQAFARHRLATIEDLAAHHAESLAVNYDQARATAIEECAKAVAKVVYTGRANVPQPELDLALHAIAAIRQLSAPPPPPVDVGEGEDG